MSDKTGVQQALAKNAGGALDRRTVASLIEANAGEIKKALPQHLTVERMTKVMLLALDRTPALLQCSQASLIQALMQCAELGLEPGGVRGHAYLIPYGKEVKLIVGYKGMVHLAKRSGELLDVEARVVHEGDKFDFEFGSSASLVHKPALQMPGKPIAVYCIAKMRNGQVHVEVMSWAEIMAVKARSASARSGPWVTDEEQMARKTCIKRTMNYLEISPELADQMDREDHDAAPEIEVTAPPAPKKRALRVEPTDAELTAGDIDPDDVARQAVIAEAEKALAAAEKGAK